jgi:hypothetical protein
MNLDLCVHETTFRSRLLCSPAFSTLSSHILLQVCYDAVKFQCKAQHIRLPRKRVVPDALTPLNYFFHVGGDTGIF